MQEEWKLSLEQVAEFKEVFMLFDKDEDGVITFPELIMVMKSLGQRPASEKFSQIFNFQKFFIAYNSRIISNSLYFWWCFWFQTT